jgi:hypothetical protein
LAAVTIPAGGIPLSRLEAFTADFKLVPESFESRSVHVSSWQQAAKFKFSFGPAVDLI